MVNYFLCSETLREELNLGVASIRITRSSGPATFPKIAIWIKYSSMVHVSHIPYVSHHVHIYKYRWSTFKHLTIFFQKQRAALLTLFLTTHTSTKTVTRYYLVLVLFLVKETTTNISGYTVCSPLFVYSGLAWYPRLDLPMV